MKKQTFVLLLVALFLASSSQAMTVTCVNCSDKITQLLDRATNKEQLQTLLDDYEESVTQTEQQIEMVANQVKMYANMVQNTERLPDELLGKVTGTFKELASLTGSLKTQTGDVAALATVFEQLYEDSDFLEEIATAQSDDVETANSSYFAKWQEWSDEIERAAEAVFQVSGQQLQDLVEDGDALDDQIENLLSTPEGQMQALDSANQLAALQLKEARELRTLLLTTAQAGSEESMKAERQEELRTEWWKEATRTDKLDGVSGTSPHADPF